MSLDHKTFLYFLHHQALDFLTQIVEEALIFALQDANQGSSENSTSLITFLTLVLDFFDLGMSKQY